MVAINSINFKSGFTYKDLPKENSAKVTINDTQQKGIPLVKALENYDFASKYYNENLNNNKPVITDFNTLNLVLTNPKLTKALSLFIGDRARSEIRELNAKHKLNEQEKEKLDALKQLSSVFPSNENYLVANKQVSFKGELTPKQKTHSHLAIHGASAVCAGISGLWGEGAAVGADTPFLWGAQGLMFLSLKKTLNVDSMDHAFYIARQLAMGQVLGVKGAKLLINWIGIGGHAASAGTASAAITPTIRGVNAVLSSAITEKMGWGYVSACEKDRMTWKKQALQTAIYGVGMHWFGHGIDTVMDATDPDNIQAAMDAVPKKSLYTYGKIMKSLMDTVHLDRFGFMFTANIAEKLVFSKNPISKDELKNALGLALINTTIYDLIDYEYEKTITDETILAINKLGQELKDNPEVYAEFMKSKQALFDKLDLENTSVQEFINKFKDKKFVYNIAMMSGELSRDISDKWRKRNFGILKEQSNNINKKGAEVKAESAGRGFQDVMTPERQKEIENDVIGMFEDAKSKVNSSSSFTCLNKVAGYDDTIKQVNDIFITPYKNKEDVPSLVLFYGPSGTGKTSIGLAIAETIGAKFIQKGRMPKSSDANELLDWLNKKAIESEETYRTKGKNTIVQINEMGPFENYSQKDLDNFGKFIDVCAKKHHMSIFLTSNNPLSIDSVLLKKSKNIALGVANKNDLEAIVKYYLNGKITDSVDFKKIAVELEKVKPERMYSNSQVEQIIESFNKNEKITESSLIEKINKMNPTIEKTTYDKFIDEKNQLS